MKNDYSPVSFADIAHGNLTFDPIEESSRVILSLLDTPWVQRLRHITQTGNSRLVYMFAEHSRFGHSLGVAFLANSLLQSLERRFREEVAPYKNAVAAAALLHDIGHVAPGSHLAEKVWGFERDINHEDLTHRIIDEDSSFRIALRDFSDNLIQDIICILSADPSIPNWTSSIICGDGWNADRGNWSLVDSALCAVNYGRYNVNALLDSFRISPKGQLVLAENRLDALIHFFVARDSMYRQVYQHRVLQAADALTRTVVVRLRDIINEQSLQTGDPRELVTKLNGLGIFCDLTMAMALTSRKLVSSTSLEHIFLMTEHWWSYHLAQWCGCPDTALADLASRLQNRRLFKTVRVESESDSILEEAREQCRVKGYNPRYYCLLIDSSDVHRKELDNPPLVLLDNGTTLPVTSVEPVIANLYKKSNLTRRWIAVPNEVKEALGRKR